MGAESRVDVECAGVRREFRAEGGALSGLDGGLSVLVDFVVSVAAPRDVFLRPVC